MEFKNLFAFMAVVEHGTFTEAAKQLYVSQPSLSKNIKKLEEDLDVELLDRSTRHVTLTDAGRIVYNQGNKIQQSLYEMRVSLDDLLNVEIGSIRLGIPPLVGTLFFPTMARIFQQHHPNITLELVEQGAKLIGPLVENGDVDLGIVVLPADERKFEVIPILEDQFYIFLHESHPLADCSSIHLKQLSDDPFILFTENFSLHDHVMAACQKSGFTPKVGYKSSQWDLIVELVASNLGVTLLPKSIYEKQNNPNIRMISIEGMNFYYRLGAIRKKKAYSPIAVQRFLDLVVQEQPLTYNEKE